nr:hypothetical protein [Cytophagales bacterium]
MNEIAKNILLPQSGVDAVKICHIKITYGRRIKGYVANTLTYHESELRSLSTNSLKSGESVGV